MSTEWRNGFSKYIFHVALGLTARLRFVCCDNFSSCYLLLPCKLNNHKKTMLFCKGIPFVAIGAMSGILCALFGALCGWVLFPVLVKWNIDKVDGFKNERDA